MAATPWPSDVPGQTHGPGARLESDLPQSPPPFRPCLLLLVVFLNACILCGLDWIVVHNVQCSRTGSGPVSSPFSSASFRARYRSQKERIAFSQVKLGLATTPIGNHIAHSS